ncbi:MAG: DNA polymerase III subunit delta, partial [Rhodospirillales bacterium]|nr:DNA polymerase III subunit delta [Rhodospirillales bacterium]
ELGLNPVGVALALERRAAQLAQIAAYLGPRGQFDQIDKGAEMRLGIFFKEKRDIAVQYKRWTQPTARGSRETRLDRLIGRLIGLHRTLIANSQTAELLLAQELTEIARYAAKR